MTRTTWKSCEVKVNSGNKKTRKWESHWWYCKGSKDYCFCNGRKTWYGRAGTKEDIITSRNRAYFWFKSQRGRELIMKMKNPCVANTNCNSHYCACGYRKGCCECTLLFGGVPTVVWGSKDQIEKENKINETKKREQCRRKAYLWLRGEVTTST